MWEGPVININIQTCGNPTKLVDRSFSKSSSSTVKSAPGSPARWPRSPGDAAWSVRESHANRVSHTRKLTPYMTLLGSRQRGVSNYYEAERNSISWRPDCFSGLFEGFHDSAAQHLASIVLGQSVELGTGISAPSLADSRRPLPWT